MANAPTILHRLETTYEYLVDETENPATIHDRDKNKMLSTLLELFEYLRGEDDYNPIPDLFEREN